MDVDRPRRHWSPLPAASFCNYPGADAGDRGQCWYDLALAAWPSDERYVYAGGIRLQRSDGSTWTDLGYDGTSGIHVDIHSITFDASNRVWVGSDGGIYRKDSGSTGFVNLSGTLSLAQFYPGKESSEFIAPLIMDPANAQRLYIGTTRIWRTENGGDSWDFVSPSFAGTATAVGVAKSNSSVLYAVWESNRVVLGRTTDGGATWSAAASLPNRRVTDIEVNPANAGEAFVSLAGSARRRPRLLRIS